MPAMNDLSLQRAIAESAARGWRLQSAGANTAVLVSGGGQVKTYWGLHLALTLLTCGLWGIPWAVIAIFQSRGDHTERSLLIMVDDAGHVSYQEGR